MILGGLQKLTLIDYPGKIAATVFTVGCNFYCPFCHNPELVDAERIKKQPRISEKYFFDFLSERQGTLEGVCITGGEPTLHSDLPSFISQIKNLGFFVKLDTNGANPAMLGKLLAENLLDFAAMDIKAPLEKYKKIINKDVSLDDIQRSVELVFSAPDYEFRTTVLPSFHSEEDILSIGRWLRGAKKYVLQQFQSTKTLNPAFEKERLFDTDKLAELRSRLKIFFDKVEIRD